MLFGIKNPKLKTQEDSLEKIINIPEKPKRVWDKFNRKFKALGQELGNWWHENKSKEEYKKYQGTDAFSLEEAISRGNWDFEIFKDEKVHISALNLLESGRITWEQKSTISDITETARYFGNFTAYPILDSTGDFSEDSKKHLLPLLYKNFTRENYSDLELNGFKKLLVELPLSERFFFVYWNQKMDEQGSMPSKYNVFREQTSNLISLPGTRFMDLNNNRLTKEYLLFIEKYSKNQELANTINSKTHLLNLRYKGVLKLSTGAENALGLVSYGQKNWFATIPGIDRQTINDVDRLGHLNARPTITPESRLFGMISEEEKIHGVLTPYPDIVAHDNYHREAAAFLGYDVHQGIERIIRLARDTFGIYWSKDIWLLRDFDLGAKYVLALNIGELQRTSNKKDVTETTRRFAYTLKQGYLKNQLENCPAEIQNALAEKDILFDTNFYPNQIALCFIIDLARNPDIWLQFNISNDEKLYLGAYPRLIKMAKFLHEEKIFTGDMKADILKFDTFIKLQGPTTLMNFFSVTSKRIWECPEQDTLENILKDLSEINPSDYNAVRNNKQVFLGFRKIMPQLTDKDANIDETLSLPKRARVPETTTETNSLEHREKKQKK